MRTFLTTTAAIALMATAAHAGSPFNTDPTEAQKRKIVVPDIKQLTYCVARQTLADSDAVTYYRQGNLGDYVGKQLQKCPNEFNALLEIYESTYGDGEAERFVKGPYLADLPRAVLSVIKPQLQAKVAAQLQDEQNVRDAESAQEAEAKRKAEEERIATLKANEMQAALEEAQEAEAKRKAEEERLATLRLQAEQAAQLTKIAQERQNRIDIATGTMNLLRDKFYGCADQQLPGLVRSGEAAEVLANTAMTICSQPLADATQAAIALLRAKDDPSAANASDEMLAVGIKPYIKERVVADAVQAKAGVGSFAMSK